MQTFLKTLIVGAMFAVVTPALAADKPVADAAVGTWNLNLAKSKFTPGPAPKSQLRTYVETPQGLALTIKTVGADGKESSMQSTFRYDGKDYPYTGSPDFDAISVKRVNGNTVSSKQKQGGKVVGTSKRVISTDGKVMTLSSKGTNAKGPYENVYVYDRQ
jgi:hypothetical protein